jgi:hypothetical protein
MEVGYLHWPKLVRGTLIKRYKRFMADVRLRNGHVSEGFSPRACPVAFNGVTPCGSIFKIQPPRRQERQGRNGFSSIPEDRIDEKSHPGCGRRENILNLTCPVKYTLVRSGSGFNRGLPEEHGLSLILKLSTGSVKK